MIDNGEFVRAKRVNEPSGTELARLELLVVFEVEAVDDNTCEGAVSTPEEGVYGAVAVVVFDPAELELDDEYDVDALEPEVPEDAFA